MTHSHTRQDALDEDGPVADISTWQHTIFTRDRHPRPQRDSNPQCQ
jgi:hypothetical protein